MNGEVAIKEKVGNRYKCYPEYRDFGNEWFGGIPFLWKIQTLKRCLLCNDSGVWGEDFDEQGIIVLRSTDQTIQGNWKIIHPAKRKLTKAEYSSAKLHQNDLVITKSSGSALHIGKTTLVTYEIEKLHCCHSNFMQRIRVNSFIFPKFMWYFLNSLIAREQLSYLSTTTTGLANLNGSVLNNIIFIVPKYSEQMSITRFLDKQTATIDQLIEKKERFIELLQEKRTALITHVVTKGLDPDIPMKDSGIEWLGQIPEHWKVNPLFSLMKEQKERNVGNLETNVLSLSYGKIIRRDVSDNFGLLPESFETYQKVNPGNIILRLTDLQNDKKSLRVGFVEEKGIITSAYLCLKPGGCMFPNYVSLLLHSYDTEKIFYSYGGGVRQSMKFEDLKWLPLLFPPLAEQKRIVSFVHFKINIIDSLINKIRHSIELLKEYRIALITAAVTGKIDLREEVVS